MKKAIIEAYNELMKVNVRGADIEYMYNALVRLAAVINAPETKEEDTDEHVE